VTVPTYLHPGVYLEEVSSYEGPSRHRLLPTPLTDAERLTRSWTPEHTHVAFVGVATQGPFNEPTWLDTYQQFEPIFGEGEDTVVGGAAALPMAVQGFFANGGQSCVVTRIDHEAESLTDAFRGDLLDRTGIGGLEAVDDVSLVCVPDLWILYQHGVMTTEDVRAVQLSVIAHCEQMGDRLAILDCPPALTPQQLRDWRLDDVGYDSSQAAVYYPWIKVYDAARGVNTYTPPCGHIAGVYARTDALRGFDHSPANQSLTGALSVELALTAPEMDVLNPLGINAIIPLVSRGPVVWGNRTLSSDPSRRLIHQRRVLAFIVRNLRRATVWAIFERADDETLGPRIAADIRELLLLLWRSGALWGHSAETAFWVNHDPQAGDGNQVYVDCEIAIEKHQRLAFRMVYLLT
jgi:phage tail sheath protein FI